MKLGVSMNCGPLLNGLQDGIPEESPNLERHPVASCTGHVVIHAYIFMPIKSDNAEMAYTIPMVINLLRP